MRNSILPDIKKNHGDFQQRSLGDVHVNAKGAKTCQLTSEGGKVQLSADDFCATPFGPSDLDEDPLATWHNLAPRIPR